MGNDPAFLFYDGDASRDVSHMNRLERGCYFDLIQAQKKFGPYTIDQAHKILGKDFKKCWPAVLLILKKDENSLFFIPWLADSIAKRKHHSTKQRERIQQYWDNKKDSTVIPRNDSEVFHGSSNVYTNGYTKSIPLVNENENIDSKEDSVKGEKWNCKPVAHFLLTEDEIDQAKEFISRVKLTDVPNKRINDFWIAFQTNEFTGDHFYHSRAKCIKHFRDWLKFQELEPTKPKGRLPESTSAPLKKLV
jgi:hypothetical protein